MSDATNKRGVDPLVGTWGTFPFNSTGPDIQCFVSGVSGNILTVDYVYPGTEKVIRGALIARNQFKPSSSNTEKTLLERMESMGAQDIRLLCGELSAQEMRTAKALLGWFSTQLRNEKKEHHENSNRVRSQRRPH